jgi:hypothetical protein
MTPTWRWLPYVWATMLTVAVAIARLYFGADWLTDVMGGLTLGLVWVAALGLSLRRHTRTAPSWRGLGAVSLATLVVAFSATSLAFQAADLQRYRPVPEPVAMSAIQWREGGWRSLPQWREDLRGRDDHPLNLQYAGDPQRLTASLTATGWKPAQMLALDNFLRLLSPSQPLRELPVIPHVHDGHHGSVVLVRDAGDDSRLVLRLWATPYRIEGTAPLWVGAVTSQHKKAILDLLAVPTTDADSEGAMRSAKADLAALHPKRPAEDAPLLLDSLPEGAPPSEAPASLGTGQD